VITHDWAVVDFYAVLGVARDATDDDIADSLRALAKRLHPDVAGEGSPEAERFKTVTAAYEVLSDPRRRADYDLVRSGSTTTSVDPRATGPSIAAASGTESRWTPRRARLAIVAGFLAFVAGVAFSVFIVSLKQREHDDLARRVEVIGTVAKGAPNLRLAYLATTSAQPFVVAAPDTFPDEIATLERVDIAYPTDQPSLVMLASAAPSEWTGRATAEVLHTSTGTQIVYAAGEPAAEVAPWVAADPSSHRSGALVDGQTLGVFYDPGAPFDIRIAENTTARDITFWFIAIKLLIAGPALVGFALVRVRRAGAHTR
jgi:hypothetical protein